MDIHKPKPMHNLREFLGELATIILGILIALAMEEGLRTLHDRSLAHEAHDAVYAEIRENLASMQGRAATLPCAERRLDEIGALLSRTGDGSLSPQPHWIGQPAIYFMETQRWLAATGSGRTSLFAPDEQGRVAAIYAAVEEFRAGQQHEQDAWAQLRGLEEWGGPLGPAGRVHFTEALQAARYALWDAKTLTGIAVTRARALGVEAPVPAVLDPRADVPHAVCLPIGTSRAQALAQLEAGGNRTPGGQPR